MVRLKQYLLHNPRVVLASIVSVWLIAVVSYGAYHLTRSIIIPRMQERLRAVVQSRIEVVNDYINAQEVLVDQLALSPVVVQALEQGVAVPSADKAVSLAIPGMFVDKFPNILLVNTQGAVIAAEAYQNDFVGQSLVGERFASTHLGRAFEQASLTLTPTVSLIDYDVVLKKLSLYIVRPVFSTKRLIGYVAVQLSIDALYDQTHTYFDLGNTGAVILVRQLENSVQIVSPVRNDPSALFRIIEFDPDNLVLPLHKAVLGMEGADVSLDYRHIETMSAWGYVPSLSMGLVVKIDLQEAVRVPLHMRTISYALLICAALMTLVAIILYRRRISHILAYRHTKQIVVCAAGMACFSVSGVLWYRYYSLRMQAVSYAQEEANTKLAYAVRSLIYDLKRVMLRADGTAEDIRAGRLQPADMGIRVERELQENNFLSGLAIVYAPSPTNASERVAVRARRNENGVIQESVATQYNFSARESASSTHDYVRAFTERRALWSDIQKDQETGALYISYSIPFYEKGDTEYSTPLGIIIADYPLSALTPIMQTILIGETGFGFIVDREGRFAYHPSRSIVDERKTLITIAQQQTTSDLYTIAQEVIRGGRGAQRYTDSLTRQPMWAVYEPLPLIDWSVGVSYAEAEIAISSTVQRHFFIQILVSALLGIILLASFLFYTYLPHERARRYSIIAANTTLFTAFIGMFFVVYSTFSLTRADGEVVVASMAGMNAYVNEQKRKAAMQYTTVTTIPTGITIYSLAMPNVEQITFSGYVWQTYPVHDTSIVRECIFEGALETEIQELSRTVRGSDETIVWKVKATLQQYHDYTKYPFDYQKIAIQFVPKDTSGRVLFIPALEDYANAQGAFVGLTPEFSVPEFNVQRTYFSYVTTVQTSTQGTTYADSLVDRSELQFNVIVVRDIINALIMYLVPAFVILFSLYAIFLTDSRSIASYTGLLFALILLHGTLRSNYRIGGFLYIEYLFFLSYVTIFLLIIYAIILSIMRKKKKEAQVMLRTATDFFQSFFWTMQFASWLVATILVFYN